MNGQLFQLKDIDGEDVGLLWTSTEKKVDFTKDWEDYWRDGEDPNADDFADLLAEKYPDTKFERIFTTDINA